MNKKSIFYVIICIILLAVVLTVVLGPIILMFLFDPRKKDNYSSASKYTENEVVNLVNSYVLTATDEAWKYKYDIIEKKPLIICVREWNACNEYKTIEGAYQYIVKITDKTTNTIEAHVIVEDKYKKKW